MPLIQDRWDFYKIISLDGVDIVAGPGNIFEHVADRYKSTQWIDITYPSKKPTTRVADEGDAAVEPPAGDPGGAGDIPGDRESPETRRKKWAGR